MKNIAYYQEFRITVNKAFPNLIKLKKENDQKSFNALLLEVLPEVRKYINGRLVAAIQKGHFPKGKYKADDFIDQLFIEVYDHIGEVGSENEFYAWLFKKTNELLEDTILEEEFDNAFVQNIDDYSKAEWDEMAEKYSIDGGGDLLMIDELDDSSYNHNDYTLNAVFVDDTEKELTAKIDKSLSEEEVARHINMVLSSLPLTMRDVFDLYTNQHFSMTDIAKIKARNIDEIEKLMNAARKALHVSFFNRFLTD